MKWDWGYRNRDGAFLACRVVLGSVFIYAAAGKFGATQDLADSIATYKLLPDAGINLVAMGLPLFEFGCGLLLLTGYLGTTGLLGIIGLLIIFLAALVSAIVRGLPVNCGCFGANSWLETNPWAAAARDIVLLTCAVYAYGLYPRRKARPMAPRADITSQPL